mmetsp:Transcript_25293/g.84781  ORF Transcript_25293/g.84781 Transcript_25293/m.84781 type:complete len:227 (+) Transcript_25293:40-720(+)
MSYVRSPTYGRELVGSPPLRGPAALSAGTRPRHRLAARPPARGCECVPGRRARQAFGMLAAGAWAPGCPAGAGCCFNARVLDACFSAQAWYLSVHWEFSGTWRLRCACFRAISPSWASRTSCPKTMNSMPKMFLVLAKSVQRSLFVRTCCKANTSSALTAMPCAASCCLGSLWTRRHMHSGDISVTAAMSSLCTPLDMLGSAKDGVCRYMVGTPSYERMASAKGSP